ncbi:hypothetical protein AQ505_16570 [Pedobacter sp. PACM 27299]|uniref:hypothetical protein n=1 Tax=Pedobacter sp. PACM 27299 TaxID=1727164 RepID=UPI000706379B|nr:hypothetical protein [Pedobacter sp. PACM 27299]ALL06959.1 hypothetical protein AQ505_16570 [Pedobacter sp. PACM 27299]
MIRFLKYYYFRIFSYFSDGSSIPLFRTFAIMFVFVYFNLLALITLIFSVGLNIRLNHPVGNGVRWFLPLVFIVPLFALFYHRLKRSGLHDLIFEEYSKETKKQKISRGWIIILYFIGSILLFISVLWLRQKIRGY